MNCKPGDLAVIVGGSRYAGMLVHVIEAAPIGSFLLPDGHAATNDSTNSWVVKSLSGKFWCPGQTGEFLRYADYGFVVDSKLRPIRDQDGEDEMIRIVGKPNKEKVDG